MPPRAKRPATPRGMPPCGSKRQITLRAFRSLLSASRFFNVPDDQTLEALLDQECLQPAGSHRPAWLSGAPGGRGADPVARHGPIRITAGNCLPRFTRSSALRVGPHGHDAAGVPVLCRGTGTDPQQAVSGLRAELLRLHDQQATAGTGRPARRRTARTPLRRMASAAWQRSVRSMAGCSTTMFTFRPTAAICSIPTAFRSSKVASRATSWRDTEANPLPVNNRTVLHLLEALQMLQVKVPGGGPAEARGSVSGHSTSNRSATSTRASRPHRQACRRAVPGAGWNS